MGKRQRLLQLYPTLEAFNAVLPPDLQITEKRYASWRLKGNTPVDGEKVKRFTQLTDELLKDGHKPLSSTLPPPASENLSLSPAPSPIKLLTPKELKELGKKRSIKALCLTSGGHSWGHVSRKEIKEDESWLLKRLLLSTVPFVPLVKGENGAWVLFDYEALERMQVVAYEGKDTPEDLYVKVKEPAIQRGFDYTTTLGEILRYGFLVAMVGIPAGIAFFVILQLGK